MPKTNPINTNTDLAWQPSILRMTAFSTTGESLDQDWWNELVGIRADSRIINPMEEKTEGSLLDGKLILSVDPVRVNLRLTVQNEFTDNYQFATLGPFQEKITAFTELVDKWLRMQTIPSMSRLAFGATLLQPAESLEKGYQILKSFLPSVEIDIKGSSDLFYQINRPRPSKIDISGLEINRLTKWSILRLNTTLHTTSAPTTFEMPEAFAVFLELDINTSKEFQEGLPREKLPDIFDELITLGNEIAELGDIK